jgi:glycosyltransferase involved in cell wall biosynthesis
MIGSFGIRSTGMLTARALPLAKALVARGHEVELIVPPWDNPSDARREWTEEGVEIKNTGVRLKPLIAPRLVRQALNWKPDVIHFYKPRAYAGLAAVAVEWAKVMRLSRTRLVIDEDGWEGTGRWDDRADYANVFQRIFAWQDKHGTTHNNALTVASRPLETFAIEQGAHANRVFYLPNGAGLKVPDCGNIKSSNEPLTVLLYTRFFEFRVERVIEVWKRVLEKCPGTRFMVVGKGYNGEEEELLERARVNGYFEQVSFHGWVADEAVPQFFAKADVAVYPVEDTPDNSKRCAAKLPDLLAAGLPVAAEAVGQIPEYIRHNDTGCLVKPGDVEGFATAVVNLLGDRDLRLKLGGAARAMMEGEFAWDKLAQIAEKAYTA